MSKILQKIKNKMKHFFMLPDFKYNQSKFDMSHSNITSFNIGELIPIRVEEILPSDTFTERLKYCARLSTLVDPIFDSLILETFTFYVKSRDLWDDFKQFFGENDTDYWTEKGTYAIPQITSPSGGWQTGSLADYFGVPIKVENLSINALPFRAYCKIVNEWFLSENFQEPLQFSKDMTTIQGSNGTDNVIDCVKGGMPFTASKYHDIFTSCLPEPQKGDPVSIPLGTQAPLFIQGDAYDQRFTPDGFKNTALKFANNNTSTTGLSAIGVDNTTKVDLENTLNSKISTASYASATGASGSAIYGTNQYADLSVATAATINDLRFAFALQKYLEKDARYGTRYVEFLNSHFGVSQSDEALQRSIYIGHTSQTLNVAQVIQTSESSESSALGQTGAMSVTINNQYNFTYNFKEHGYLITLACVRYVHSYNQGLPKLFSRKDRYDFYDPVFSNIGEQPIFNEEIFAQGTTEDKEIFGYNEAWVQYRYHQNSITGQMRTTADLPLDTWHLGDHYESLPKLSDDFLKEDKNNVDRVLQVTSDDVHQVIANFIFDTKALRVLPVNSIPKL